MYLLTSLSSERAPLTKMLNSREQGFYPFCSLLRVSPIPRKLPEALMAPSKYLSNEGMNLNLLQMLKVQKRRLTWYHESYPHLKRIINVNGQNNYK